jgi:hypothetical protein
MAIGGGVRLSWAQAPAAPEAPAESPAAREWRSVTELFSKTNDDLNAADRSLASFVATGKLTPAGRGATHALAARIDAARTNLQSSLDAANLLAARPQSSVEDAARFRAANLAALTEATAAAQAADAATRNPAYADHSEEQRAEAVRKAAEAAAARQAAEQARKDADAQRKADEDQRRASADSQTRAGADAKASQVQTALQGMVDTAKQVSVALDALLSRNDLTSEARNAALRLQRRADANAGARLDVQGKLSSLHDKAASQALAFADGCLKEAGTLGRELTAIGAEQKALSESPRSFLGAVGRAPDPSPAPAEGQTLAPSGLPPRRSGDIVPICEFTFEPADGKPMEIAVDGGPLRPMPARARLASGRHTLSLRRDATAAERHELLLCGYVSTVPIEPIE